MSQSSSSQVGLYFFFLFSLSPFFPPPQLLGRSFTLQLHPRTRCCRRWQVHSCLFPAAGIQQWSSRRGVTPANLSKKKSTQAPNFPGSCPAVRVAKSSTWMTGRALGGWRGWWGYGPFWQQWLLNWLCCLLICALTLLLSQGWVPCRQGGVLASPLHLLPLEMPS